MKRVILKLSGEALSSCNGAGISAEKVKDVAYEIKDLYNQGIQIGIVIGAGNIWRGRDAEENGMERAAADYMGMLGTILNCLAMQNALESIGIDTRVMSALNVPSVAEPYIRRKALKHFDDNKIVIFAGGTGAPFFTTDTTSALRAAEMKADYILMAKNGVDGVYNKDPRTNKDAVRYSTLTYDDMLQQHLQVMDLTAATLCSENNIKIIVFDMSKKGNISKVINEPTIGTIITK